jgi:hypothetical protein
VSIHDRESKNKTAREKIVLGGTTPGAPDLQELIERCGRRFAESVGEHFDPFNPRHGGYQHITASDWVEWDRQNAEYQAERRRDLQAARDISNQIADAFTKLRRDVAARARRPLDRRQDRRKQSP